MTSPNRSRKIFGRYLWTTLAGVVANLTLYLLMARVVGIRAPIANLVAACLVIGPRFWLHKYWVWKHRSTEAIGREVAVHTGLTVVGLTLSTAVAAALEARNASAVQLAVGNVGAFGVVWVARFLVSHFYLFTPAQGSAPEISGAERREPTTDPTGEPSADVQSVDLIDG